jgi:hypothetical protein
MDDGPLLRITSQSLRVLDLEEMPKANEVGCLACPALEEVRLTWNGYGSRSGLVMLKRSADGGCEPMHSEIPHEQVVPFGAGARVPADSSSLQTPASAPCRAVDLPPSCRVIVGVGYLSGGLFHFDGHGMQHVAPVTQVEHRSRAAEGPDGAGSCGARGLVWMRQPLPFH